MIGTACEVRRREKVSRVEFEEEHLASKGAPLIVTDAMDHWPARHWSFEFFRERYGEDTVIVTDRLGRPSVARKLKMRDYLRYIESPESTSLGQVPSPTPLYCNTYSPFSTHRELLNDFSDPYFIENAYRSLRGGAADWYNQGFGWIFIGPAGTVSQRHVDLFGTHAWLAQVTGRKRFRLFDPTGDAQCYEFILEPGEVVFIPAGWSHEVVSLAPSISLTFNFVCAANFAAHILAISRDLPGWSRKVDTPTMREAAGIQWTCKGWLIP